MPPTALPTHSTALHIPFFWLCFVYYRVSNHETSVNNQKNMIYLVEKKGILFEGILKAYWHSKGTRHTRGRRKKYAFKKRHIFSMPKGIFCHTLSLLSPADSHKCGAEVAGSDESIS